MYIGQLAGLYEALNAGVTSVVDYAHCAWSDEHVTEALRATRDSGVRGVYAYNFGDSVATNYTFDAQVQLFESLVGEARADEPVQLGMSYDAFNGGNETQTQRVLDLAR